MQRLLHGEELWPAILRAIRAAPSGTRRAAVAYVTDTLLDRFAAGDRLVVDASPARIADGATSVASLRSLYRRGVVIASLPGLHAKVWVLDRMAIVGSANASRRSQNALHEAAVMTDGAGVVAATRALIESYFEAGEQLDGRVLGELAKISVVRTQAVRLPRRERVRVSNDGRFWLLNGPPGTEMESDSTEIAAGLRKASIDSGIGRDDITAWERSSRSAFARRVQKGDRFVWIWISTRTGQPRSVAMPSVILNVRQVGTLTILYSHDDSHTVGWSRFVRLCDDIGLNNPLRERVLTARHANFLEDRLAQRFGR